MSEHATPQTSPPAGGVLTPPQPAPPRQVLAEVREETHLSFWRRQIEGMPPWLKGVILLSLLGGIFYLVLTGRTVTNVVSVPEQPAPQVVVQAAPVPVSAPAPGACACEDCRCGVAVVEGRAGPARRLLGAVARNRVSAELQENGFAAVGGDPTPLARAEADRLAAKLDDATVAAAGELYGFRADGDRPVLDFLRDLLQWMKDHEELIRFLLSLLMLL